MKKIILLCIVLFCSIRLYTDDNKVLYLHSINKLVGSGDVDIDTATLLKAISFIKSRGIGAVCLNENMNLLLNKHIDLPSNIRLFSEGRGATLEFVSLSGNDTFLRIKNTNNILIENLKIYGNSIEKRITALGIFSTNDSIKTDNIMIRNCSFQKNTIESSDMAIFIRGIGFSSCKNITIENCIFKDYFRGIVINGKTEKIKILNNSYINIKNGGIYVSCTEGDYCQNVIIKGNTLSELGGLGYHGYPIYLSTNGDSVKNSNIRIIDNDVFGNYMYYDFEKTNGNADMIAVYDCENTFVQGNSVRGGGDVGICLWRSNRVLVYDNIVSFNNTKGIAVYASNNCIVANNIVYNNCLYKEGLPKGYKRSGIFVHNYGSPAKYSYYNYIVGNRCYDDRSEKEKTQDYGIYITKNNCYNYIGENLLEGNKKYNIVSCEPTTKIYGQDTGLINCSEE